MGNFYYFEILRQVYEYSNETNIDFFVFGESSGIYIKALQEHIGMLKQTYENRHEGQEQKNNDLDHFLTIDRQPLFLYSDVKIEGISEDVDDSFPIVLTLIPVNKEKIPKYGLHDFLKKCRKSIADFTKDFSCEGCTKFKPGCALGFDVAFNLGEADIAVIFRAGRLRCIARLLLHIRNAARLADIPILSTSSLYGFPKSDRLEENIKIWFEYEKKAKPEFSFNIFYNAIAGAQLPDADENSLPPTLQGADENLSPSTPTDADAKKNLPSFMFGEWDYQITTDDSEEAENLLLEAIKNASLLYKQQDNPDLWYRSSNTNMSFKNLLQGSERSNGNQFRAHVEKTLCEIRRTEEKVVASFYVLIKFIHRLDNTYGQHHANEVSGMVASFEKTMCGLLAFLARLYIGRFEQDLYQCVSPVFGCLSEIIRSYSGLISKDAANNKKEAKQRVQKLVDEFIRDTGKLISYLQQIFMVLGFSPHTFLETYSSSMRSLAAASKLVGAYYGIIRFIKRNFASQPTNSSDQETHVILLTPYRKAQPTNTILFALSNPKHRISNIQVDYTKLFKRHSVYMLLHEYSHTLTDRKRKERFSFFMHARMQQLFFHVYDSLRNNPIDTICEYLTRDSKKPYEQEANNRLFYGIDYKEEYEKRIKDIIDDHIYKKSAFLAEVFEINYNKNEKYSQNIYYMRHITDWSNARIIEVFNKRDQEKEGVVLYQELYLIDTELHKNLIKIFHEIKEHIRSKGGNIREAIRLEQLIASPEALNRLIQKFEYQMDKALDDQKSKSLLHDLFQDVYSDLFSILLLGDKNIDAALYIEVLFEFAGAEVPNYLTDSDSFLLRVMTIAETMGWSAVFGNDESFSQMFASRFGIPQDTVNVMRAKWKRVSDIPYWQPVREYADLCRQTLEEQITKIGETNELQAIRGLWQDMDKDECAAIDNVAGHIFTLWSYLMSEDKNMAEGAQNA